MKRRAAAEWIIAVSLSLATFSSAKAQAQEPATERLSEFVFQSLPLDVKGLLTKDKLLEALSERDRAEGTSAFEKGDADHDGALSAKEFAGLPARILFRLVDRDHSGACSPAEIVPPPPASAVPPAGPVPPPAPWTVLRRRLAFEGVDANRDGELAETEFLESRFTRSLAGSDPVGPIPDEVLSEVERALSILLPNGGTSLAAEAWRQADWNRLGPDWTDLAMHKPDGNGDGQISRQEAREAVEIALGIRLADGTLIRLPEGFAFKNVDFGYLDENKDRKLTQAEYIAKFQPSREVALANFARLDLDKDGSLTPAEAFALMRDDLISTFLRHDADRDGNVTPAELEKQSEPWEKNVVPGLLPGYDEDGDGSLSYREFAWTPLQTRVVEWNQKRRDVDGDARLSYEEFRQNADLFASVLSRRAFRLRDTDGDGFLSYKEFPFDLDPAKAPPEVAFKLRDQNADGQWTFEEVFNLPLPKETDAAALNGYHYSWLRSRVAFEAADTDHNGTVSAEEFLRTPYARTLQGASGHPMPDVLLEEVDRALSILLPGDSESLAADNWPEARWETLGPDWATLRGQKPDTNSDGQISRDEARRAIEIALGVRLADGTLIRLPDGFAFKNVDFGYLDEDKDRKLTQAEYVAKFQPSREVALKNFVLLDQDKDGILTPAEAFRLMREDLIGTFLRYDSDRDGHITPAEIETQSAVWEKNAIPGLFPGFDENGDGALSYREFGWTPLQTRILDWNQRRRDLNDDGKLSYEEFRLASDLFASVLLHRSFRLRDRNRDGVLTYDEYPFEMNPAKAPPEVAFQARDQNADGEWTFEEAFNRARPKESDAGALAGYHYGRLRIRLAFDAADADRSGTVSLEELLHSPYAATLQGASNSPIPDVIQDEVVRALGVLLPADAPSLPAGAWRQAGWDSLGQDWTTLQEQTPDQDGDGQVSRDEARRAIEIALGVRFTDSAQLRFPEGIAFNIVDFSHLDENKDRKLTQAEYVAKFQPSREVALQRFAALDLDKDGILTTAELLPQMRVDLIGTFLRFDVDRNGRVTPEEVERHSAVWEKNVIPGLFPGFDLDGDGGLSYHEFGWTPLQTRVIDWNSRRRDLNDDTKLSYEEFRLNPNLFVSVLSRRAFRLRDVNEDGMLTYDEFPFEVDARGLPKTIVFKQKDLNRDGQLEFSEAFLTLRPEGPGVTTDALRGYHSRRTRCLLAFRATDLNSDSRLSRDEFLKGAYSLTALSDVPSGPVPDPVLMLAAEALQTVLPSGKESLTASEWKRAPWGELGPDWIDLAEITADRDRDGTISPDEAKQTIEIALGIRLADGTTIRLPTGHVFKNVDFGYLDENKDRKLTQAEYVAKFQPSRDVGLKNFERLDQDRDQYLTPAELVGTMRDDLIGTWTYFDASFDGRVTPEELAAQMRPWEQNAIEALFPGFDENGDGGLSYEELGLSPVQNRILDWNRRRRDSNNDTYLSYVEFRDPDAGPFTSVLARRFFRLRDLNGDGRLGIDEYSFDMDVSKVPIEIAFKLQDKDKNGMLSLEEVFTEEKPAAPDTSAQERYEMRLAAAESRFLADDRDRDGGLSPAEFQQSREAALAAVERKTQALTRHRRTAGGGWFYPVILAVNAAVLLGGGWYLLRRNA